MRTRPISIITSDERKTSTADEVWAGKMTTQEATTGSRMGRVPSRQIFEKLPGVGTIRSFSMPFWREASCRARKRMVATFSPSEGWRLKPKRGIQRAAPLVVWPMK